MVAARSKKTAKPDAETDTPKEVEVHIALGARLKQRRLEAKLTLAELAERSGFGKAYLSRIENGKKVPPIGTLSRITDVLGIEATSLLTENPHTA
jgi:transcriptional regulator with XRE-family HTH domain